MCVHACCSNLPKFLLGLPSPPLLLSLFPLLFPGVYLLLWDVHLCAGRSAVVQPAGTDAGHPRPLRVLHLRSVPQTGSHTATGVWEGRGQESVDYVGVIIVLNHTAVGQCPNSCVLSVPRCLLDPPSPDQGDLPGGVRSSEDLPHCACACVDGSCEQLPAWAAPRPVASAGTHARGGRGGEGEGGEWGGRERRMRWEGEGGKEEEETGSERRAVGGRGKSRL